MAISLKIEVRKIKHVNIGLTLLIVSAILYGSTLISASVYSQVLNSPGGGGWDSRYGVFKTALLQVGTLPLIIATLVAVVGMIFIVQSVRKP